MGCDVPSRLSFNSMRSRILVAVTAMVLALIVLCVYAGFLTLEDGLRLRGLESMHKQVYGPTEKLVTALQGERRLSVELLANPSDVRRAALDIERKATDKAAADLRRLSQEATQEDARLADRIRSVRGQLRDLKAGRESIDGADVDQVRAGAMYSEVVASALLVLDALPANSDPMFGDQQRILIALERAREALSREVAVLAGSLAEGGLTAGERRTFLELRAAQRDRLDIAISGLDDDQLAAYQKAVRDGGFTKLRDLENQVVSADEADSTRTPFSAKLWNRTGDGALEGLRDLELTFAGHLLRDSGAQADTLVFRALMITVGGALFVILMLVVWIVIAPRHVVGSLHALGAAIDDFDRHLPEVAKRLGRGEKVDVDAAVPRRKFGPDEFGDVGRALNKVERTAVEAAIEAAQHLGTKTVLANLARRTQSLVHRQLRELDTMEREAEDPRLLERLFTVDHLATRMRRHAEDLIILAGSTPARRWRKPVAMVNVVRAAAGEVEHYRRVQATEVDEAFLVGRAVGDVTHLLAELIENATSYSPPTTKVRLRGFEVSNGFAVEIIDCGLGIAEDERALYNDRLADPPEFAHLPDTVRLGLIVVGHLAKRHGIRVTLSESPYGGITTVVLIPTALLETPGEAPTELPSEAPFTSVRAQLMAQPASTPDRDRFAEMDADRSADTLTPLDVRPELEPDPEPGEPEEPDPGTLSSHVDLGADEPSGEDALLPKRVRQQSLAQELRDAPPPPVSRQSNGRTPEQIRSMMSAFQRGTRKGRTTDPETPEETEAPEETGAPEEIEAAEASELAARKPSPRPQNSDEDI